MSQTYFTRASFKFLKDLAANNNREWFHAHKPRYEAEVREPFQRLIADLAEPVAKISPHLRADPRAQGGSLFRIQRDTRFANDKTPYKTWTGARLFHERSREIEAPSFYIHLQPGDCFGATPNTAGYGHLRYDTSCPGPDDEYLPRFVHAYTSAALIGANMEPDVSGDAPGEIPYAAAIFLHRHVYDASGATKATSGCVSIAQPDLDNVLIGMRPGTLFVMGPTSWLREQVLEQ